MMSAPARPTRRAGLDEMDVHAHQKAMRPMGGVEHGMAAIYPARPFRLGDIGVGLAVGADHALRPDEHGGIVIEVGGGIDLRHADDDVAVLRAGDGRETLRGRAGDRLDKGGDSARSRPAIAGRAHFRRDDELRARAGGLADQRFQPGDVAPFSNMVGSKLDGRDLQRGGHGRSPGMEERSAPGGWRRRGPGMSLGWRVFGVKALRPAGPAMRVGGAQAVR